MISYAKAVAAFDERRVGVEEGWREGDGDLLRRKYSWRGYLNTRTW